MDREWGAQDALAFVRRSDFTPSALAFDAPTRGAEMADESEVGFLTMGRAGGPGEARTIGVGMLGYAFMGKAHSNAYRKIAYMTWPPLAAARSVSGRTEEAVAEAARRSASRATPPTGASCRERRDRSSTTAGRTTCTRSPRSRRPRRASTSSARSPRAHRREPRGLAACCRDRRQAHVRLQLPVRPGRAARARAARGRRPGRHLPLQGRYLQEWGDIDDQVWRFDASAAGSGALGDLGRVIDLARYLVGEIESVSGATERSRKGATSTTRSSRSSSSRTVPSARSRPHASARAARMPSPGRSTARRARSPSTSSG